MDIDLIVIHCSATPNYADFSAEDIHGWHEDRGWSGIGYHWVIRTSGDVENGRPEYWQGAHAKGHNRNSLGICMVGTDDFTVDQHIALEGLIINLKEKYPRARVIGHNEVSDKICPGFDVQEWLNENEIDNHID